MDEDRKSEREHTIVSESIQVIVLLSAWKPHKIISCYTNYEACVGLLDT